MKACLKTLPPPPGFQWAGRRNTTVAQAIASWLACPAPAGAELDLAKAYDTVGFDLGQAALTHYGCHAGITATLALSWRATRHLTVAGTSPVPLRPARGLPQGCPMSGHTLALILGPWKHHCTQAAPTTTPWAFVDDRTLKVADPTDLPRALAATAAFDKAIGLVNNVKKQQTWPNPLTLVEHLGVTCDPTDPTTPILPRDGWEKPEAVINQIGRLPGSQQVRCCLLQAYGMPLYHWAAPVTAPPPLEHAVLIRKAAVATKCSWWCHARWFMDHLAVHPTYNTAIQALRQLPRFLAYLSPHLLHSVGLHLAHLGLRQVTVHPVQGLAVCPTRTLHTCVAKTIVPAHNRRPPEYEGSWPRHTFWVKDSAAHTLRLQARALLLARLPPTRFDAEGAQRIDLQASSDPLWSKWRKDLSQSDTLLLTIWRAGASSTPTRRYRGPLVSKTGLPLNVAHCPHCGQKQASARHFWADCPHFAELRDQLQREYSIAPSWWGAQPRVTSKTGWITLDAHP